MLITFRPSRSRFTIPTWLSTAAVSLPVHGAGTLPVEPPKQGRTTCSRHAYPTQALEGLLGNFRTDSGISSGSPEVFSLTPTRSGPMENPRVRFSSLFPSLISQRISLLRFLSLTRAASTGYTGAARGRSYTLSGLHLSRVCELSGELIDLMAPCGLA